MCQLFALNSSAPSAATFAFTGFSARGGGTADHADGWGMAFLGDGGCRLFIDDAPACRSPLAAFLRQHPIRATTVLAHIRKATQGAVQLNNCHPFQRQWAGRPWAFGHNGNLKQVHPPLDGHHQPVGSTDSERAFCWLLQALRQRLPPGPDATTVATATTPAWRRLAPVLAQLAGDIARHGPFNFLLSDGDALYAHCSTRLHWLQRRHPFSAVRLVDADLSLDLSRDNAPADRMALVATEPLTHGEPWAALQPGELVVFAGGELVWRQRTGAGVEAAAALA
ncbi:MAG TPA: class II glutamine amidotransferase [Aquabacterium sp.]|nr:class II glutamine amidotransferase [Aquabacterium sp.]